VDGRLPPQAFRDKLVVIGVTTSSTPDKHATPLAGDREMPGAELQANAIATIADDSPLRNTSTLIDVIAVVLLGAVPALAGFSRSRRRIAAAIVAALVAFLAVAQLAFQAGWILPVVAPLGALLAATVGLLTLWGRRTWRLRRAER
jgi:CHASE2 domain-containing sensor protein